jgi:hypothetical protein
MGVLTAAEVADYCDGCLVAMPVSKILEAPMAEPNPGREPFLHSEQQGSNDQAGAK